MADLIPGHEARIVAAEGGWSVWSYRGATVLSCGINHLLIMPGFVMHHTMHRHVEEHIRIIDCWLDHGDLPAPDVWKDKAKD